MFHTSEPFAPKEDQPMTTYKRVYSTPASTTTGLNSFHHRRFPKHHRPAKINCNPNIENFNRLDVYLRQKETVQSSNSLNFESELFAAPRPANLIASEPFRRVCSHPWKYSFKTRNYQTCTEQFRRVKSSCVDLSKY